MDTCKFCWDEFTTQNKLFYIQDNNNKAYKYCYECTLLLINETFYQYINQIKTEICKTSLIISLRKGVPTYYDEIKNFYHENKVISGKLTGSLSENDSKCLSIQLSKIADEIDNYDHTNLINVLALYNL